MLETDPKIFSAVLISICSPIFLDKLNIFNFILINVAESVKYKHAQSQQNHEHAQNYWRTDVANGYLRYSFHHNHQPMICFTVSSSNKILLNFFVHTCTAILDLDIEEVTLSCNVSTVFNFV